jgi:hypothetical protein
MTGTRRTIWTVRRLHAPARRSSHRFLSNTGRDADGTTSSPRRSRLYGCVTPQPFIDRCISIRLLRRARSAQRGQLAEASQVNLAIDSRRQRRHVELTPPGRERMSGNIVVTAYRTCRRDTVSQGDRTVRSFTMGVPTRRGLRAGRAPRQQVHQWRHNLIDLMGARISAPRRR